MRCVLGYLGVLALSACGPKPPAAPAEPGCPVVEAAPSRAPAPERPRLVVWLTIDQLRGDAFSRFAHLISADGLGKLLGSGLHFSQATYGHAITETAPGHATLFTGASPRDHGIIANEWLDGAGQPMASVGDTAAPLVGPDLDPSELAPSSGRSPRNLLLPTLGDSLRQVSLGRSKVVGVSLKDRAAILPAGRSGQAFWLGKNGFLTSRYYATELLALLADHHRTHPPSGYLEGGWPLLLDEGTYRSSTERAPLGARAYGFPHAAAESTSGAMWLRQTPLGDVATIDLAEHLVGAMGLGVDDVVDLLSVSLSSTDYVGHAYGPESREAEDNFARLDRLLSRFFAFLNQRVGDARILYVLSADHGISETAESAQAAGLPAGRMQIEELDQAARASLAAALGSDRFLLGVSPPGIYLDQVALGRAGHDLPRVRQRLAADVARVPGVFRTYALDQARDGTELGQRVSDAMLEGRSGDVYVVLSPHMQFADGTLAASHGSPWFADRHVPIVLSGPGVPAGTVHSPVDVRALAGSVADLLGVSAPAGAHSERLLSARFARQPGD